MQIERYFQSRELQKRVQSRGQIAHQGLFITISKVADLLGFTEMQIRDIEKRGLLGPKSPTGYYHRRYGPDEIDRLALIKELIEEGYSLNKIPPNFYELWLNIQSYLYDVALSYAGEDRTYAESLAEALQHHGVKVFYDQFEKTALWGKNLYTYLSDLYQNKAKYCIMFLSKNYATKVWTNHEREAAQARAFKEHEEYILPIRLDGTAVPGMLPTISYLRWPPETAETISDIIRAKLVVS